MAVALVDQKKKGLVKDRGGLVKNRGGFAERLGRGAARVLRSANDIAGAPYRVAGGAAKDYVRGVAGGISEETSGDREVGAVAPGSGGVVAQPDSGAAMPGAMPDTYGDGAAAGSAEPRQRVFNQSDAAGYAVPQSGYAGSTPSGRGTFSTIAPSGVAGMARSMEGLPEASPAPTVQPAAPSPGARRPGGAARDFLVIGQDGGHGMGSNAYRDERNARLTARSEAAGFRGFAPGVGRYSMSPGRQAKYVQGAMDRYSRSGDVGSEIEGRNQRHAGDLELGYAELEQEDQMDERKGGRELASSAADYLQQELGAERQLGRDKSLESHKAAVSGGKAGKGPGWVEKERMKALAEIEQGVAYGDISEEKAQQMRAAVDRSFPVDGAQQGAAATAKGPAVGTVKDGYRYKGGDPKEQSSWEKV